MAERQTGGERGPEGSGRWLKLALFLSLALNLFVVAIVAGASFSHHRWRPHHGVRDVGFGLFSEVLTREDRAALRDAFLAAAPDFRDRRRAHRSDFEELAAALRADPWDGARVDALIARHVARIDERFELGRSLLSARLAGMTAAERAALADRIDAALARGWRN